MQWWKERVINIDAACPVEETIPVLEDLRDDGYEIIIFRAVGGACPICRSHEGEEFTIDEVIDDAEHDAAIYTITHPGCKCQLIAMGEDKPNVRINYTGRI